MTQQVNPVERKREICEYLQWWAWRLVNIRSPSPSTQTIWCMGTCSSLNRLLNLPQSTPNIINYCKPKKKINYIRMQWSLESKIKINYRAGWRWWNEKYGAQRSQAGNQDEPHSSHDPLGPPPFAPDSIFLNPLFLLVYGV